MRAQHFETSEVRAQEDAASLLSQYGMQCGRALHANIEIPMASRQEIHPVMDGRRKGMIVAEHVSPAGGSFENPLQVFTRDTLSSAREQQEIETDGIEQPARHRTAQFQRDPGEEPNQPAVAAFGLREPSGAHG